MTKEEAIWILENRTVTGELKPRIGGYTDLYDFCLEALKQTSAQPEIIRCKDCMLMLEDKIFHRCWCNGNEVNPDHFCGYAERRTDALN